jgi:hypothetical protein
VTYVGAQRIAVKPPPASSYPMDLKTESPAHQYGRRRAVESAMSVRAGCAFEPRGRIRPVRVRSHATGQLLHGPVDFAAGSGRLIDGPRANAPGVCHVKPCGWPPCFCRRGSNWFPAPTQPVGGRCETSGFTGAKRTGSRDSRQQEHGACYPIVGALGATPQLRRAAKSNSRRRKVKPMRFRFRFSRRGRKARADAPRSAREQRGRAQGRRSRPTHAEARTGDPIRDWETPEQQFLRQAGDPFLDG